MAEHDPQVAGAGGLRRVYVLLFPQREELAADESRERRPEEQGEDHGHAVLRPVAEEGRGSKEHREPR
jgi:hypothetical protein